MYSLRGNKQSLFLYLYLSDALCVFNFHSTLIVYYFHLFNYLIVIINN